MEIESFSRFFLVGFLSILASIDSAFAGRCVSWEPGLRGDLKLSRSTKAKSREAKTENKFSRVVAEPKALFGMESFFERDLSKNLLALHPLTAVDAAQSYLPVIRHLPPRTALDPLYRVRKIQVYPSFAGESPASEGKMIIGQYDAVSRLANIILRGSRGDKIAKALMLVGPGGTGKTEIAGVADTIKTYLSNRDPQSFQFSFEWINLRDIPSLTSALPKEDRPIKDEMLRSPFTLLRPDLQNEALRIAGPAMEDFLGYRPIPWRIPSPKSEEYLFRIFEHYFPERSIEELSEAEYLAVLNRHVRIFRRQRPTSAPANIIRAVDEDVRMDKLFVREDIRNTVLVSDESPLRYQFNGQALQLDGGLVVWDDGARNPENLLNVQLELINNGVASTGTGPAVQMNAIHVFTANDESVAKARENMALKAFMDRMEEEPTRGLLHPYEIAKLALYAKGTDRFLMRPLVTSDGAPASLEPMNLNRVYTLPNSEGLLEGPNRRYSLYYVVSRNQTLMIAPHVLDFLGIAVSMTRIETSPQKLVDAQKALRLNTVGPQMSEFTDPVARVSIFLGHSNPEMAVRLELDRLRLELHEGQEGISHRFVDEWFAEAINIALAENSKSISLLTMDRAFTALMDRSTKLNNESKAKYIRMVQLAKMKFIFPALDEDVRQIISGDGERAKRIYREIEQELIAREENPEATEIHLNEYQQAVPIDLVRLAKIQAIYKKVTGREFSAGFLMRHLHSAIRSGSGEHSFDSQLMKVIGEYLVESETTTTDRISQFMNHYEEGRRDPSVERMVTEAEHRLSLYGYDVDSFKSALAFLQVLRYQAGKQKSELSPD